MSRFALSLSLSLLKGALCVTRETAWRRRRGGSVALRTRGRESGALFLLSFAPPFREKEPAAVAGFFEKSAPMRLRDAFARERGWGMQQLLALLRGASRALNFVGVLCVVNAN